MDSSTASWILIFGARVACTDLVREIHWDACARYEVKDLLGDDPFKPGLVILSVVPPDGRLRAGLSDGVRSGELFQIEMDSGKQVPGWSWCPCRAISARPTRWRTYSSGRLWNPSSTRPRSTTFP